MVCLAFDVFPAVLSVPWLACLTDCIFSKLDYYLNKRSCCSIREGTNFDSLNGLHKFEVTVQV